jgi:hypothetical protein
MSFLAQGKTNWKYILVVLILAAIVGGGILSYLRYFEREIVSISQFPEIKKPEKITERNCKDIQDLGKKIKCYTDLAKNTKDENYCGKIEIPEFPEAKANCYHELAIIKEDPSICWEVETASLASSCWEHFGMKDWKIYKNEVIGIEFKYSKEWELEKCIDSVKYFDLSAEKSPYNNPECNWWIDFASETAFYKFISNIPLKDYFCNENPIGGNLLSCDEIKISTNQKGVITDTIQCYWNSPPPGGAINLNYCEYRRILYTYLNNKEYPIIVIGKKWGQDCFLQKCGEFKGKDFNDIGKELYSCLQREYESCKEEKKNEFETFERFIKSFKIF